MFEIFIRKSKYENDPRDAINDNVRRKYPKIVEDQSSYLGEWKNGKRDGIGILTYKNTTKFIGNFVDNNVNGLGKLIYENGKFII